MVPAPAIKGKAIGTIEAELACSSRYNRIPSIISKAKKNNKNEPKKFYNTVFHGSHVILVQDLKKELKNSRMNYEVRILSIAEKDLDGIYEYATIPSTSVLPVQFAKYDIQCNDKGAIITWATATEQNSNRFEIQRSSDGINWTTIDNVVAAGNSNDQKNYQYLDLNGGTAFYRIRQVDNDGRFVYTAVKRTDCKKTQYDVALYPVPAKDNLSVVIRSDNASRTELQIMDMLGKTLQRVPAQINRGNNNFNLNVSELPAGQYMLVGSDPSIQINKKFRPIHAGG